MGVNKLMAIFTIITLIVLAMGSIAFMISG